MEISKLFEKASSLFDNAQEKCSKSGIDISCITLMVSENDVIFHGVNWKRLKDDFTEEETCSEYEALIKMVLSGETKIKSLITLNSKKETVKPCLKCAELILFLNIENKNCNIITGKNSQITLSSCDKKIDSIIDKLEKEIAAANPAVEEITENTDVPVASVPEDNNEEQTNIVSDTPSETVSAKNDSENTEQNENAVEKTEQNENDGDAPVKAESFDMESIDVSGNEVLTSAAEDKQAHNNDNSSFAMEEINKDSAPEPVDSLILKSNNDNQSSVQMADINDPVSPDNVNSEAEPVSHLGIDNSGLKMIFDDWEALDVSENSDDSVSNKPFNINSLNTVENTSDKDNQAQTPASVQPDMNQTGGGMYQQQPMNGMYQQQPMNSMYQQQPMNGMYQQQPMNSMYQQQPMNGMYQQQPMNGMYQQQPMNNGMYQQQPTMSVMYQQQPTMSVMYQQPMNSMYQRQQVNSINSPGSLYMNQMPQTQSVSLNNFQTPYTSNMQNSSNTMSTNTNQSMSVYGTNINTSDNNAIFKDRLNNILNSGSKTNSAASEEQQYEDAIQSAKDRKKAAKIDAKFLKKQKRNGNF